MAIQLKMREYLEKEDQETKLVGDFIKSFLYSLNIRQNKFAEYLKIKPSNFNKLLKGERSLSYEMAIILGNIFKVEPRIWLNIQAKNKINQLKQSEEYSHYSLHDLL